MSRAEFVCVRCGGKSSKGHSRCWRCYKADTRSPEAITARFWAYADQSDGPAACWPWTGTRHASGYGQLSVAGRYVRASRLAWEIANDRPWPKGKNALHRCDNPPCVNPAHIYPGTQADNVRDMLARNRQRQAAFCPHGHDQSLWRRGPLGARYCLQCSYVRRDARRRAVAA